MLNKGEKNTETQGWFMVNYGIFSVIQHITFLYPTPINRNDWNFRLKEQNNRMYEGEMSTREEKFVDL